MADLTLPAALRVRLRRRLDVAVPSSLAVAVAVLVPLVVVYAALLASSAIARPLSETGDALSDLRLLAVSAALCLAPLAVWPLRLRAYALVAGLGLAALAFFNLLHIVEYSELVTLGAIDAVVNTSGREAGEFLTGRLFGLELAALGTLVSVFGSVWAAGRIPAEARVSRQLRLIALALGVAAGAALAVAPMRLFPLSTVKNVADYVGYRARYRAAQEARQSHHFGATTAAAWTEPPVVVLVIGESLRRRELGLYGYRRDTTPLLKNLDSLIVYTDAVTTAPVTQAAVKMLMTGATPETAYDFAERSWVALAREVGYQTAWVSNQDRTEGTETVLVSEDAEDVVYTSHSYTASAQLDEDVLPEVDRVLGARRGPLALVVHLMGSHEDYSLRYPARFDRFRGGDGSLGPAEQALVDAYDNSVAYTDWVVSEIVARVAATGAPAVVGFVSDHGENLFDGGGDLHGHGVLVPTDAEVEVPLLFWTSPAFRAERPTMDAALRANRQRPVSTGDLFDTFADLLGTDWRGARPERSLLGAAYRPEPRRLLTQAGEVVPIESVVRTR